MTIIEQEPIRLKFSAEQRDKLFSKWIEEIPDILEIIEMGAGVTQEDFFSYFQAQIEALQSPGSLNHFQILDNILPRFFENNLSVENLQTAFIRLRNLLIQQIGEMDISNRDRALKELVSHFDDLLSFLRTNYQMMEQFRAEEYETNITLFNLPLPILAVSGKRFERPFIANQKLLELLPENVQNPASASLWHQIIPEKNRNELQIQFNSFYQEKLNSYHTSYCLLDRDGGSYPVVEVGQIEYLDQSPVRISAFIIPQNLVISQRDDQIDSHFIESILHTLKCGLLVCNSQGIIERAIAIDKNLSTEPITSGDHLSRFPFGSDILSRLASLNGDQTITDLTDLFPEEFTAHLHGADKNRFMILVRKKEAQKENSPLTSRIRDGISYIQEVQQELTQIDSPQSFFQEILKFAMELLPESEVGFFVRFSTGNTRIASARGFDYTQLKNLSFFNPSSAAYPTFLKSASSRFKSISKLQGKELLSFFSKYLDEQKIRHLNRHLKLDELPWLMGGLLTVGNQPVGLLLLGIHNKQFQPAEDDIFLFEYLLKVYGHHWQYLQKSTNQLQSQALLKLIADNFDTPALLIRQKTILWANTAWMKECHQKFSTPAPLSEIFNCFSSENADVAVSLEKALGAPQEITQIPVKLISGKDAILEIKKTGIKSDGLSFLQFRPQLEETYNPVKSEQPEREPDTSIPVKLKNMVVQLRQILNDAREDCLNLSNKQDPETIQKLNKELELAIKLLPYFEKEQSRKETCASSAIQLSQVINELSSLLEKNAACFLTVEGAEPFREMPVSIPEEELKRLLAYIKHFKNLPISAKLRLYVHPIKASEKALNLIGIADQNNILVLKLLKDEAPPSEEIFPEKFKAEDFPKGEFEKFVELQTRYGWIFYKLTQDEKFIGINILIPAKISNDLIPKETEPESQGAILAVDDEKGIRDTFQALFNILGYPFFLAENGAEAKSIYQKHSNKIELVLLDYSLSDTDGKTLLRELREINPQIRVILCSGYSDQEGIAELMKLGVEKVLPKPFTIEMIKKTLDEIFHK
ncbi:MAG: hypothetical protein Kow0037_01280 [Calditrichia bacterium]